MKSIYFNIFSLFLSLLLVENISAQCDFTISNLNPCGSESINFSINNPSGLYGWDFDGDGNTDVTGSVVNYTFPQLGVDVLYTINIFHNNVLCETTTLQVLAAPDATLGVIPGNAIVDGELIRICSPTPEATLQLINLSTTLAINDAYFISWGDGTTDSYTPLEFGPSGFVEHDYSDYGYYNLSLTINAQNGCTNTINYTFYNGSNPSVGLANPGNTVGLCAPATIEFPITNYASNPIGTIYNIYISGELVQTYTQANVPSSFSYTFEETSCGLTTSTGNYSNAFDVQVEVVNPCGSSQATIEPIEISTPPELEIETDSPETGCIFRPITVTNASTNVNEIIAGNPSICESSITPSWTISPGVAGIDWDIIAGNVFGSNEITIVFNTPGNYTITMSINSPSCGPSVHSQSFNIIEGPSASSDVELNTIFTGNVADECAPSIGTFENTSTGDSLEYNWLITPNSGWSFQNGTSDTTENIVVEFLEAGTYSVALYASNECEVSSWDTTFIIADTPLVSLGSFGPFCETATLTIDPSDLNINPNGGIISAYNWSFPGANPNSSLDQFPTGIYYDSPGSYSFTLEVSNQCGSSTATGTLEIDVPGNLLLDNDITVCQDSNPFILFADPQGGTWNGNGITIQGLFTPNPNNIGTNSLIYTYGSGACILQDSLIVTVLPSPTVDAGEPQTACENEIPFLITGGTPIGGTWSASNGGIIENDNTFNPLLSGVGTYALTYSYTDANGCSATDEKIIVINAMPIVEAGPNLSVCENPNDIPLTGHNPLGGTWFGIGVSVSGTFNVQNTPGQGSYLLFYEYTDPNTACVSQDSLWITVVANDTAQAGENLNFCLNDDPHIFTSGIPEGGYWTGPGVDSTGSFFDPSIAGVGTHVVNYNYGSGICQTSDSRVIAVQLLPTINLPNPQSLCLNDESIDLSSATPSGGTWIGLGIENNYFNPATAGVGEHRLTYHYRDTVNNCSAESSINIEVFSIPSVTVSDTAYCNLPGNVSLPMATPANGSWDGPGMVGANTIDPTLAGGSGNYKYTYSYTNQNGCTTIDSANIFIFEPANVEAGPSDSICLNHGLLNLNNFSPSGGIWSGTGIVDSLIGIFDPSFAGGGTHTLTYTYGSGNCQVSDQKIVFVIDLTGVGVGGEATFCLFDEIVDLQASGPLGGFWSGPGIMDVNLGSFSPSIAGPGVHTITYQYTDPLIGCTATADKIITVNDQAPAAFDFNDISCTNQTVSFTNLSTGFNSAHWDFGDGTATIANDPLHIYETEGTYSVTLTIGNDEGCADTLVQNILIATAPIPDFQLSTNQGCGPLEVSFVNQSAGYEVDFQWDFGNGNISVELIPENQIYEAGLNDTTYYTSLVATNLCGSVVYNDSVSVNPQPVALFAFYPEEPCSPMTVNFGNASYGSVENFYWDFGNGNFSTDTLPESEVYTTDTTIALIDVLLVASNACGIDSMIQTIEITPADVRAFFTVSDDRGCEPFTVDFSNFATFGANVDWEFGDGNSSIDLDPVHTFTDPGTYTVIQYATSECGYDTATVVIEVLPSPQVSFENSSYVCIGNAISFLNTSSNTTGAVWDFGDGTGSTLVSPEHVYDTPGVYDITLTGFSQFNQCPASVSGQVVVQGLPVASFEPQDQFGCAPFNATFINNSLHSEFYIWDFGDGNTSVDQNPSHLYEDIGTYEVSLISTDTYGCSNDTSILNILVHPTPEADFEFDLEAQCSLPALLTFENQSIDANGFSWNLGDGSQSNANNPTNEYLEEGNYEIDLVATNQFNCSDSITKMIQVIAPPDASFEAVNFEGCSPVEVNFEHVGNFGDEFYWNFGDGQVSSVENPTLVFEEPGNHSAQLIVGNGGLCFDTVIIQSAVTVYESVLASFTANPIVEGVQSGGFAMINNSTGASYFYWEFSDGLTSEEESPTHQFSTNGVYQIYLEASNDFGCVDDTLVSFEPDWIKGLFIPSGFSPEQGLGDVRVFKPAGIGLKEYKCQIFSPYGQLLWESDKLTEEGAPAEFWDGTFKGNLLPQDVYVWKAFGMFGDGTVWPGEEKEKGGFKTLGSVILLR